MKTVHKTLMVLASLFLAYQTYQLVHFLLQSDGQTYRWFIDFTVAFSLNLFATGIFAFMGFAFPTHRLLPRTYFSIKRPAALSRWYRLLGVGLFRDVLMLAFWGKAKNRKKYFNGTREGIENFVYQTKQSEFGHLSALMVIAILSALLAFYGHYPIAVIALVINFFGNLYPILLQRHHRLRLGAFI